MLGGGGLRIGVGARPIMAEVGGGGMIGGLRSMLLDGCWEGRRVEGGAGGSAGKTTGKWLSRGGGGGGGVTAVRNGLKGGGWGIAA